MRDFITPSWLSNVWQSVPEEEGDDVPPGIRSNEQSAALPGFPAQGRINLDEEDALQQDEVCSCDILCVFVWHKRARSIIICR